MTPPPGSCNTAGGLSVSWSTDNIGEAACELLKRVTRRAFLQCEKLRLARPSAVEFEMAAVMGVCGAHPEACSMPAEQTYKF